MPCSFCGSQFTIFKRKRACISCHCLYCSSCLGKKKKNFCTRCELIFISSKRELLELKTKDLIFFLQSRKINIAGIVEKEELCNLIINHINSSAYYDTTTSSNTGTANSGIPSSSSPNGVPNDFENYAHSFDQIKQTCQSIFSSLSDKIASDFQKTTCFNQTTAPTAQNQNERVTTQPRSRARNCSEPHQSQQHPGTSYATASSNETRSRSTQPPPPSNCECSDEEMEEICEKRQSIFDANGDTQKLKKTKLSNSSSINSSSFEEIAGKHQSDDDENWQIVDPQNSNEVPQPPPPSHTQLNKSEISHESTTAAAAGASSCSRGPSSQTGSNVSSDKPPSQIFLPRRRCSDSSLLNMKKSSSINIDMSSFNPNLHSSEIKKIKVSCRKCGKTKSKIKNEILKLSEQLKTSNRSELEINAKIKEFMDYLETKSQPSEITETTDSSELSQHVTNDNVRNSSVSNEEIGENVFDENEGINVYASNTDHQQPSCSSNSTTTRRFISLGDINTSADLEAMTVKQLKEILMLNRVDFKGCCEKNELKERVQRLWESYVSAPPSDSLSSGDLCKICMDAPIECVFLECGHSLGCIQCCKVLSECPICRSYIVRVVRIFKS